MLIQALGNSHFGIFEAYLALGLIVGIGGIGVVTVSSVSERRKTIGILRALGYRKRMVMLSFLIEVSWVAVLGIVNGVVIALDSIGLCMWRFGKIREQFSLCLGRRL